jgi:hypothetical protein
VPIAFTREGESHAESRKRRGIVLDDKAQEQSADKDRAQKAAKTNKTKEDDELQPLREKSGF